MTEKDRELENLLTEISSDAKALKIVFDDMLLNDMEDLGERIFMGKVFVERLSQTSRHASELLITKE